MYTLLTHLAHYRWVDLDDRNPPVALILTSVTFKDGKEQLYEPVVLAQVLDTPTVAENDLILYSTASNELRINGTGFIGAKDIDLYFDPPLLKEIAYEIVSKFPCTKDEVVLRLRHGYEWRKTPGPLYVKGIDTGGGAVKIGGDEGVQVAVVSDNLPEHQVTVDSTFLDQVIYHDQSLITISGSGFNTLGNTLRFSNGILGRGVNYTVTKNTESTLTLQLTPGSFWRGNMDNLPGYLTLLAVNAGEGFVAVGPVNSAKGRDVATVFERPNVVSGNTKLYQTHTHELHIYGAGFTTTLANPQIKFSPALTEGVDYTIRVVDRDDLEITLKDQKSWGPIGPLIVQAINSRGDDSGWVTFPGSGVHVAEIVEDIGAAKTAGVEIYPMGIKVYQSVLQHSIDITGDGFADGMDISFEPVLKAGTDYDMRVVSKNKATLTLRSGKKWRSEEGLLMAMSITVGGKSYPLAGGAGIRVAVVLLDPSIEVGSDTFHETQSKVIGISGKGFTNVADTKITIKPTDSNSFKILAVLEDTIRLQLKQDLDWLPSYLTLKPEDDKKIPLEVLSIDTGAGEVHFPTAIVVGYIVADRPGVTCDDSCEFAFDGVCDDGSVSEYAEYYEKYGAYGDDWQENEYADDEEEEEEGDAGGRGGRGGKGGRDEDEDEEDEDDDAAEDDYYMEDDSYKVSACVEGTDCTDCGGVDAQIDYSKPLPPGSSIEPCSNTCVYARDGVCDDPRGENYCAAGTDCQDCGPIGADNFTRSDDDGWWDDDDDYWNFNDGNFLDQAKGLEANRDKVRIVKRESSLSAAAMFLTILEGIVYTIGAVFAAIGMYAGWRWYNGQSIPFLAAFNNAFNPDVTGSDLEGASMRRMPVTPDVIRT